jgi:hypothetical protein
MRNTNYITTLEKEALTGNSTYPKGGFSCSEDSFEVARTLVFQIKFCSKSSVLRGVAKLSIPQQNTLST